MRFINLIFLFYFLKRIASWIEAGDTIYVDVNSVKKTKDLSSVKVWKT